MTEAGDSAVLTEGLERRFGGTRALDGIDLRVARGEVFGLLGPNGAGKTTIVRVLATLIRPTAGRALVMGHDVAAAPDSVRARIALTGQFATLDEDLPGQDNLRIIARLMGLSGGQARARAGDLLAAFDLEAAARRQVRDYSGGMRRRLDIAASMITRPEVLFLDEPTTGLDPRARNDVWAIVRRLAREGTTVFLTTQYLEEADQLADRIAVIDHGRVIAEGTGEALKSRVGSGVLQITLSDPADAEAAARLIAGHGRRASPGDDPRALAVPLEEAAAALPILSALAAQGIALSRFAFDRPSLDAVFFALTGHGATEETPG